MLFDCSNFGDSTYLTCPADNFVDCPYRGLVAGEQWSDSENDLLVADYFAMLAIDLSGRPYNKAERNRAMQAALARSHASVEFKHQNVSAVLQGLGEDWIPGYRPAVNYQASLEDAVARWLAAHPEWFTNVNRLEEQPGAAVLHEAAPLWVGPPPTHSNAPPPAELDQMMAVARKFDVAERDARNRALGHAGEERVFAHERTSLIGAGRADLAERVRWVAYLDGDGAGYDIHSFEQDGRDRLIEVKTTRGWERTPFHISRRELEVSEARRENWRLVRLWNFSRAPRAFELHPPLSNHVALMPTSFQASFH